MADEIYTFMIGNVGGRFLAKRFSFKVLLMWSEPCMANRTIAYVGEVGLNDSRSDCSANRDCIKDHDRLKTESAH